MADQVLNERIDDLIRVLGRGAGRVSRVDVIRAAIFAMPTESEEHLTRLLQYGRLRQREAEGLPINGEAFAECEGLLGMFSEDVDRADLVAQLDDARRRLSICASRGEAIADYARGGPYKFA